MIGATSAAVAVVIVVLLAHPLGRLVVLIGAADSRADQAVMSGVMSDNPASNGAPDTSRGLRRMRNREHHQRERRDGRQDRYFLHNKTSEFEQKNQKETGPVLLNNHHEGEVQPPENNPNGS